MHVHDLLPGLPEPIALKIATQCQPHLDDIHPRLRVEQGMEEHTLLPWREWVDRFDDLLLLHHSSPPKPALNFAISESSSTWSKSIPGKSEGVYPPASSERQCAISVCSEAI